MATKKITELVEITTAASDDVLPIVDVSLDITNKITTTNLLKGKQDLLESGTNIKTINSTSLLGSGDVSVQETLVSGTNIKTINSTSLLGSGNISIEANPSGGAGLIQFSDGSAFASDSNLFWDNTNKRLGVGETTPTARVHIKGSGTTVSSTSLLVQNSSGTELFKVVDGGSQKIVTIPSALIGGLSYFGTTVESTSTQTFKANGIAINGDYTAPAASTRLHIKGSGSTFATTSLLVQNSSGTDALKVRDDGNIAIFQNRIFDGVNISKSFYIEGNDNVISNYKAVSLRVYNGSAYASGLEVVGNGAESRVGIGTTTPTASAILQLDSTTKGFLPPRMTTTQKNAISSPASGLVVYDTDTNKLCCYNGTSWNDLF